ncbi:putative disease resistance protein RGA1 [Acorus calamus]|uniref:Disease resistance protein RGA1 n=1 Tax=Acorus calamus TaxID=4465 RepID=A0AAV9ETR7_ACOCL|nr:putative disease resistance protein RGA1 [Acorus calamus]
MALPSVMTDEILKRLGKLLKDELVLQWSLKDELKKLKIKLVAIKEVLHDAENRELQDPTVRKWLDELRDIMYDTEDIIDDFSLHIHHSPSSTTSALTRSRGIVSKKVRAIFYYRVIGKRIRGVNDRLQQIQKDRQQLQLVQTVRIEGSSLPPRTPIFKRPETTSYVIESEIIGFDEATERLVQLLTGSNNRGGGGGRVFAIAGMGGIGKTTLAQKVFNKCDFDNKIWLCLSQDYSEADVLKQIIWSAGGECGKAQTKQDLYSIMNEVLAGRQFLLVLDDLWSNGIWEDCLRIPFNCFTAESRVLITTRNEEIARQMGAVYIHKMQGLSDDDDAWSLLCKVLHQGGDMANIDENMKEVGMKIIKKCKGLPLAIKVIGGVLNKRERTRIAWEIILSSTIWSNLSSEVMPALLLSYMDLPSYLKPCFLYCSLFPEDYEISRYSLTRMWIAEGFVKTEEELSMTDLAEAYHQELITRSLLQVVDVSIIGSFFVKDMKCKMHDLVREMAISLTRGEHIFQCLRQHSERTFLKPRRLSIISNAGDEVVKELKETPLRSLLVFNDSISKISRDIFENIKYLRVLDLHATSIKQLPDSIGKLVHLRYLDLSRTQITELPDSLCKLKYLQTLLLVKCGDLTKLPKDFRHLQRLRHLNVRHKDKDVMMPEGIGELVHLQTLKVFTIHSNNSSHYNSVGAGLHDDEDNGCNINELGSLSQLKCLKIRGLERLRSGSEARKAMMQDKIHLRSLKLMWDSEGAAEGEKKKMEEVFEALPPPPFLQVLWIKGFPGQELPNWMIKSTGASCSGQ